MSCKYKINFTTICLKCIISPRSPLATPDFRTLHWVAVMSFPIQTFARQTWWYYW